VRRKSAESCVPIESSISPAAYFLGVGEKTANLHTDAFDERVFGGFFCHSQVQDTQPKRAEDDRAAIVPSRGLISTENIGERTPNEATVADFQLGKMHGCLCTHHMIDIIDYVVGLKDGVGQKVA
jgi:hypothetical protein